MKWWRATALALTVAALASTSFAAASDADKLSELFLRANREYQVGDFAAAEASYQQLLRQGVDSGAVYYNVGNTCFKQKKLGEAIYYWEMARRRMPGDRDVTENLELANLMVVDRIEVPSRPLPVRWLSGAVNSLGISETAWLALAFFAATNLLFGASVLARSHRTAFRALAGSIVCMALVVIFGAALGWKIYKQHNHREAVVVEQKADIRSGPGAENVTVFTVHEGLVVLVRGSSSGWYQVSLPNGWNGWIPSQSLRIL